MYILYIIISLCSSDMNGLIGVLIIFVAGGWRTKNVCHCAECIMCNFSIKLLNNAAVKQMNMIRERKVL